MKALFKILYLGPITLAGSIYALDSTTYNVKTDFNAVGNGIANDQPAIQNAINAAIAGSNNTVYLPSGIYLLASTNSDGNILEISNSKGLIFTGTTGTKLVSSQKSAPFWMINNNTNIVLQNFVMDYSPMGYSQGTITAFDNSAQTITFTTDVGFDQPNRGDLLPSGKMVLYTWSDPERVGYDSFYGANPAVTNYSQSSPGVWSMALSYMPPNTFVGEKAVIWNNINNAAHAITFARNSSITFSNVFLYNEGWNTAAIAWNNTGAIKLLKFNVTPSNPGYLISASAGLMYTHNRGTLTMDGCNWIVHQDDLLDALTDWVHILAQPASNMITLPGSDYQVGDTIEIWNWPVNQDGGSPAGSLRSSAAVTAVGPAGSGNTVLTLSSAVTVSNPGVGGGATSASNDGIDRAIDLNQAGPVIVRNGSFSAGRSRPLLIKSGISILVENNLIYDNPSPLQLGAETAWGEGPRPINVTVRNNTFRNCDRHAVWVGVAGATTNNLCTNVTIFGNTFENGGQQTFCAGGSAPYGNPIWVQNAIAPVIQNNLFLRNWDANIALKNNLNVKVDGNTFISPNLIQPTQPTVPSPGCVVWADNTQGLTLSGNLVSKVGLYNSSMLLTTPTVSGVTGKTNGFFNLDSSYVFTFPTDGSVIDGSAGAGSVLTQKPFTGSLNQQWILTPSDSDPGYCTMRCKANGLYAGVCSNSAGTVVVLQSQSVSNGEPAMTQLWQIFAAGEQSSSRALTSKFSGMVATVQTTNSQEILVQQPYTGGASQQWTVVPGFLWNPQAQMGDGMFGVRNGTFGFNVTGTSNDPIVIEACTNLAGSIWFPLQTNILTGSPLYFSDPRWTNYSGRFYRFRSP